MPVKVIGVDNVVGGIDTLAHNLGKERTMQAFEKVEAGLTAYHAQVYGKGRKDLPQTLERHPESNGRLVLTGKLRDSLTQPEAEGAVRTVTPTFMRWGTSIWYGNFAQSGTKYEKKRPLVRLNSQTRKLITTTFEYHLWEGVPRD